LKVFIGFNSNTEHDGSCLAEVVPEIRIFSLSNEVLEDVLIRSSRVLGSRGRLSKFGDKLKLFGNAISEFTV